MSCILVVEDNPVNLRLVRELVCLRGHEVLEASAVDEACACLAEGPAPELVLLDLQIPGGGGQCVLQYIRSRPQLAHLCVVALTAQAMHGDRERILATGFDAYMSKPIDVPAFCAEIDALLAAAARRP